MATSSLPPFGFSPGSVGPVIQTDGSPSRERMGRDGSLVTSDGHSRYMESTRRKQTFYCVNTAAQALSLSGTTTYTGLTLANPTNSGKDLVVITAYWATTIAPTGVGAVILATGTTVAQTTGSSSGPSGTSTYLGASGGSVATAGASCTYGANPTFLRPLFGVPWVTATGNSNAHAKDEIAGEIVVPPGQQISFLAVTTALTGIGFFSWEEIATTL